MSALDGYARYKGYNWDGGARALEPRSEHRCACGEELEHEFGDTSILCPECGVEWSVEAEGGYGDDGTGCRWWITEEVAS